MIASLLSPVSSTPPAQGRISQLLPTVKCSTCHQPVPLAELGDHTCTAPPPVPSLPKPTITPEAATALLPGRLQGRVVTPMASGSRMGSPSPRVQETPQHQRISSSASASRLKINTRGNSPTQASYQPKSSPLARSDSSDSNSPRPKDTPLSINASQTPLRTRMRTPSNAGSISSVRSTPSTARPPASFNSSARDAATPTGPPARNGSGFPSSPARNGQPSALGRAMQPPRTASPALSLNNYPPPNNRGPASAGYNNNGGPPPPASGGFQARSSGPLSAGPFPPNGGPRNMGPPAPSMIGSNDERPPAPGEAFVPPAERGIDTKTGGAAGMAGVGRRGFAAAARAAMFVGSGGPPQPPYGRMQNAPQFLDIDNISRSTSTPPSSAGSGYSSYLPGPPVDPRFSSQTNNNNSNNITTPTNPQPRTPSPPTQPLLLPKSAPMPPINTSVPNTPAASSPLSGRLPFFEKFRGRLPGLGSAEPEIPLPAAPIPPPKVDTNIPAATSSSTIKQSDISHNRADSVAKSIHRSASIPRREEREPASPIESESEYGGLAYADSTDYEDDGDSDFNSRRPNSIMKRIKSRTPPPPVPIASSILNRSGSKTRPMQFGSVSSRSRSRSNDRGDIRIGGSGPMTNSVKSMHSRENSMASDSSYSSNGDDGLHARQRSNSSAIAQALGLSRAPSSDRKILGGPEIMGRSVSGSSSGHGRRDGAAVDAPSQNGNVTTSSSVGKQRPYANSVDRSISSASSGPNLRKLDTIVANNFYDDDEDGDSVLGGMGGSKAQRSRTVQGTQSPEAAKKPIKLPMRSLTSPSPKLNDKSLVMDRMSVVKKEVKKRVRTCRKCAKTIEDGRWVSVDGGGVLCEKCWKNMYLPKCRRCNLPIEKAAVSSSDGQLKGKYHKECFNCFTCNKPFPDKTFYVYDGKPLCAYHYHEANDSLCAAALCGQPIEGPCAVSHTGDRYHPEHMTCEYPGYPECKERLYEYWEVDGRMLCEHHALNAARNGSDDDDDDERWVQTSRAKKRVTRFIDLAGAGGLGSGGADVDGSDLR